MYDKISVIVPEYNACKTIKRCLISIIEQTYKNIEIIVVDDGSDDNSCEIVREIMKKDERIKLIENSHQGSFASRNLGISKAEGKWLAFVDSDDWIEKNLYEKIMEEVSGKNIEWIDFSHCRVGDSCSNHNLYNSGVHKVDEIIKNVMFDEKHRKPGIFQAIWSKMIKKTVLEAVISQFDLNQKISLGDDAILTYGSILNVDNIYISDYCGYYYDTSNESITKRANKNIFTEVQNFYDTMKLIISNNSLKDILLPQLDLYMIHILTLSIYLCLGYSVKRERIFPKIEILCGKKIVLYGAGKVGQDYYKQLMNYTDIDLVMWVDKYLWGQKVFQWEINSIEALLDLPPSVVILIAVENKCMADEIKDELIKVGINQQMILWEKPFVSVPLDIFSRES